VYGVESAEVLEASWLEYLKNPGARIAARSNGNAAVLPNSVKGTEYAATASTRLEMRSSAAPALPILEPPVKAARGTAPEVEPSSPARPATRTTAPDRPPPVLLPPEIPR